MTTTPDPATPSMINASPADALRPNDRHGLVPSPPVKLRTTPAAFERFRTWWNAKRKNSAMSSGVADIDSILADALAAHDLLEKVESQQFLAECANTPVMRAVMGERDRLAGQLAESRLELAEAKAIIAKLIAEVAERTRERDEAIAAAIVEASKRIALINTLTKVREIAGWMDRKSVRKVANLGHKSGDKKTSQEVWNTAQAIQSLQSLFASPPVAEQVKEVKP